MRLRLDNRLSLDLDEACKGSRFSAWSAIANRTVLRFLAFPTSMLPWGSLRRSMRWFFCGVGSTQNGSGKRYGTRLKGWIPNYPGTQHQQWTKNTHSRG